MKTKILQLQEFIQRFAIYYNLMVIIFSLYSKRMYFDLSVQNTLVAEVFNPHVPNILNFTLVTSICWLIVVLYTKKFREINSKYVSMLFIFIGFVYIFLSILSLFYILSLTGGYILFSPTLSFILDYFRYLWFIVPLFFFHLSIICFTIIDFIIIFGKK